MACLEIDRQVEEIVLAFEVFVDHGQEHLLVILVRNICRRVSKPADTPQRREVVLLIMRVVRWSSPRRTLSGWNSNLLLSSGAVCRWWRRMRSCGEAGPSFSGLFGELEIGACADGETVPGEVSTAASQGR
jgi:hypothetical protein